MTGISEYRKAIAAVVSAAVAVAATFGVDIDPAVSTAVVTLLGALAVYLIPNADPGFDDQGRDDRIDP